MKKLKSKIKIKIYFYSLQLKHLRWADQGSRYQLLVHMDYELRDFVVSSSPTSPYTIIITRKTKA